VSDPYAHSARFYNLVVEPCLRSVKKKIVQECLRLNLSRVLDVGCGTGTLAGMLRKEGIQAVGLDPSPGMIQVSRGISRGSFALVRGRGDVLPLSSGSCRGVIFSMVIHENPPFRGREMLEEALRVLDPRGALFILDYHKPSTTSGQAARVIEYLAEWIAGGEHFRNYRLFMRKAALSAFLAHLPRERIRWDPLFYGSMALAIYRPKNRFPPAAGKRGGEDESFPMRDQDLSFLTVFKQSRRAPTNWPSGAVDGPFDLFRSGRPVQDPDFISLPGKIPGQMPADLTAPPAIRLRMALSLSRTFCRSILFPLGYRRPEE